MMANDQWMLVVRDTGALDLAKPTLHPPPWKACRRKRHYEGRGAKQALRIIGSGRLTQTRPVPRVLRSRSCWGTALSCHARSDQSFNSYSLQKILLAKLLLGTKHIIDIMRFLYRRWHLTAGVTPPLQHV